MRRFVSLALVVAPVAVAAQGDVSVRTAPQYLGYTLDQSGTKLKVTQLSLPFGFIKPLTQKLTFDVGTAFASSTVDDGTTKSTLSGFTDTQVRFNYSVNDFFIVTAGVNVPTGQYKVAPDKVTAAGQIGNDFLAFPVSSYGNGLAGTGGVAFAQSLGEWNLGVGGSFRKSTEFGAFETGTSTLKFQPADEVRARVGLDREISGGRVMFGVIYSKFGNDATKDDTVRTTYSSGDRLIGQAGVSTGRLYVGGWLLHHAEGQTAAGTAPSENIANILTELSVDVGSMTWQPSLELRGWTRDNKNAGELAFVGVRTTFGVSGAQVSPSVSYGLGKLKGPPDIDVTGIRAGLTIRIGQ